MQLQENMRIISIKELVDQVYEIVLQGSVAKMIGAPGQFINIKIGDGLHPYLRRPMSVCDYTEDTITCIFKVVGEGTEYLATKKIGDYLDCLVGLGNGFTLQTKGKALLIGGGLGTPPLYGLGKRLQKQGIEVTTVLGFRSQSDIFYKEAFQSLGPVYVATMDGSQGVKGTVLDAINEHSLSFDQYYSCGPEAMLLSLVTSFPDHGQVSLETRMGCGFGACMGCSCKVKNAPYKRICVEGPVLAASEVIVHG